MPTTCLDTIIGLDVSECECYPDAPEGFNTSTSGYYMTDSIAGVPMQGAILTAARCDELDIWAVMARERTAAIRDFKNDLEGVLKMTKESGRMAFQGVLAKVEKIGNVNINSTYAGQIIRPQYRKKHHRLVITAIHAGFSTTGTKTVTVRSNAQGWVNQTLTCNTVAGVWTKTTLSAPVSIPLFDALQAALYYAFTYDGPGVTAISNRIFCCGQPSWAKIVQVGGLTVNSLDDLDNLQGGYGDGYGLALEGYLVCDGMDWICDWARYGDTQLYNTAGLAILYRATARLLETLIKSDKINQYTLIAEDRAQEQAQQAHENYKQLIDYISRALPDGVSGCYGCTKSGPSVQQIRL